MRVVTADELEATHRRAMHSLTPIQRAAIERERIAQSQAFFTSETAEKRLRRSFERDAEASNMVLTTRT